MSKDKVRNSSFILSAGLHGALFLVFFFWRFSVGNTPAEFVEIGFGNPGGSGGGGSDIANIQQSADPKLGEDNAESKITQAKETPKDDSKIDQPAAQNTDEEKIATKPSKEKPEESKGNDKAAGTKEGNIDASGRLAGYGTNPYGSGIGNGKGKGSGNGNGEGDGNGDGYGIDWGGRGSRKIYSYVLPNYPDGVSKEIDVKLRFTILPDGTVGNIIPLIKADTRLENAAINSLRQWRFEPMPSGQVHVQTAVIIFPYRLQ